jgi:hypothetical protein
MIAARAPKLTFTNMTDEPGGLAGRAWLPFCVASVESPIPAPQGSISHDV